MYFMLKLNTFGIIALNIFQNSQSPHNVIASNKTPLHALWHIQLDFTE